ncbi:tRNA lysidine(34) synthetase TilS [Vibrio sp. SCSIO 43136]|uniref:tRNA lysidine(34) synthetase TilS n=1 Tax=Vibrio sp. SCSIO 43136 TaxID=2819101 RepID=UPI0020760887|nr:tRNA lysidine(34) synthetase TilS [Vibrio sp. SCSIO 43136]USD66624.1 tRNA lysidine(34) synthetase TilS [Vibrio sp. SCSIO 43136]
MFVLFDHFCQQVLTHRQPESRIVLALSGGVDSRVLLDLLARFREAHPQQKVSAVHVHHGLSVNADIWLEKCREWCSEANIDFACHRVSLDLQGDSVEQAAREARYSVLKQHLAEGDLLMTGQHSGDQLETVLLALKRGSGPKGLSAMAEMMPLEQGYLFRPLLSVSRENIESYAKQHALEWVEDESNKDTRYDRNFLRQQIVPTLKARWPSIENTIARSALLCAQQEQLLSELLADKLEQCVAQDSSLIIDALIPLSENMRLQLIRLWLDKLGVRMPSSRQLALVWPQVAMAQQDANPCLNLNQGELRRFEQRIYYIGAWQDVSQWQAQLSLDTPLLLPDGLGRLSLERCSEVSSLGLMLPTDGQPITVHFEPQGLSATPLERAHSRKLKKLFQEYGVPSWQRRRLPIVMYGDQVAAIAGLFVSKKFSGRECELIWVKNY